MPLVHALECNLPLSNTSDEYFLKKLSPPPKTIDPTANGGIHITPTTPFPSQPTDINLLF